MLRLIPILACLNAIAARAIEPDLDTAWRDYSMTQTHLEPAYRFPFASCFGTAALQYGLPETLLLAVARGESDFEATARSRANAHGVMQILWPDTARHLGIHRLSELYDPCTNIDAGARYLKELLARYDGNLHLALAAYNYGPRRIPVDGGPIPSGANWYSGTFGEPYRAAAFVESLEQQAPDLNLDWFRRGTGEFEVVMTYADRQEFDSSARMLRSAGFRID
jgi:soluble lytic murein transglycosylase-like protein